VVVRKKKSRMVWSSARRRRRVLLRPRSLSVSSTASSLSSSSRRQEPKKKKLRVVKLLRVKQRSRKMKWLLGEVSEEIQRLVLLYVASAPELGRLARVNEWFRRATADDVLWRFASEHTWSQKAYVPASLLAAPSRLSLQESVAESSNTRIDASTLTSQRWWFRFKTQAGAAWTDDDPYWQGGEARELKFLPASDDHLSCTVEWRDVFSRRRHHHSVSRWRLDQAGPDTVLRVRNDDFHSEFPGTTLLRHPSNWGLVFHSVWVCYANFPLHQHRSDKAISDRALAHHLADWQWLEINDYNRA